MKTRALRSLGLVALVALLGITFGQAKSVINVAYQEHMTTLDPAIGWDMNNWPVIHVLFVSLLTYDQNMHLVPWAATSMPEATDGGTIYTFRIQPGYCATGTARARVPHKSTPQRAPAQALPRSGEEIPNSRTLSLLREKTPTNPRGVGCEMNRASTDSW